MQSGKDIREAREARGVSQGELAQRLGVQERTVRRWENEETKPATRVLEAIKVALGITTAREPTLSEASPAQLLAEIARRWEIADEIKREAQTSGFTSVDLGLEDEASIPPEVLQDPDRIEGTIRGGDDTCGGRRFGTPG